MPFNMEGLLTVNSKNTEVVEDTGEAVSLLTDSLGPEFSKQQRAAVISAVVMARAAGICEIRRVTVGTPDVPIGSATVAFLTSDSFGAGLLSSTMKDLTNLAELLERTALIAKTMGD